MIDYSIVSEENLLHCNISGNINLLNFTDYIHQLVADEKFHPKLNTIIKVSENTKISYAKEAAGIGEFFSQFVQQRKGVAWAFVIKNKITTGLTRLIIDEIDSSLININYFETEEEAKKWIAGLEYQIERIDKTG